MPNLLAKDIELNTLRSILTGELEANIGLLITISS